jgi:hypothetical protein
MVAMKAVLDLLLEEGRQPAATAALLEVITNKAVSTFSGTAVVAAV